MAAAERDQELHRAARAGPASNLQTLLSNPQMKRLVNTRDAYESACAVVPGARSRLFRAFATGAAAPCEATALTRYPAACSGRPSTSQLRRAHGTRFSSSSQTAQIRPRSTRTCGRRSTAPHQGFAASALPDLSPSPSLPIRLLLRAPPSRGASGPARRCLTVPHQSFLSIIEPLVDKGGPLNAQTREGSTALTYLPKAEGTHHSLTA